jgi:hypothetical protein
MHHGAGAETVVSIKVHERSQGSGSCWRSLVHDHTRLAVSLLFCNIRSLSQHQRCTPAGTLVENRGHTHRKKIDCRVVLFMLGY